MPESERPPAGHRAFGGAWTDARLQALEEYLKAYTTALKRQPFELLYIDAFAGPGWASRQLSGLDVDDNGYREGSPRRALRVGGFDRYIFIDNSRAVTQALDGLREEFPASARQIEIIEGDANVVLPKLCGSFDWERTRGVVYFDPFGLELAWTTLEAVARTKLDVWLLFPIGTANRLMARTGEIDETWAKALDRLLGGRRWWDDMYREEGEQLRLNGAADVLRRKVTWPRLLDLVRVRLAEIFAGGVAEPVVQLNSKKVPLFAVFFALANGDASARALAHRIAGHILNDLTHPEEVTW